MEIIIVAAVAGVGIALTYVANVKEKRKHAEELAKEYMAGWDEGYETALRVEQAKAKAQKQNKIFRMPKL